jgi:hypothetical protein
MNFAAVDTLAEGSFHIEIEPIGLISPDINGTMGLEYRINGTILGQDFGKPDQASDEIDPDAVIGGADIAYSLTGIWAINNELNPQNFVEASITGNGFYSSSASTSKFCLFFKFEGDHSLLNNQSVYGLNAAFGKSGLLNQRDFLGFVIGYGEVNPENDTQRSAILGPDLKNYYRWDGEFLVQINFGTNESRIETLELNYRAFKEQNPSPAIVNAGLDLFQLSTIRLGFSKDFFIAYCVGELPFNKK